MDTSKISLKIGGLLRKSLYASIISLGFGCQYAQVQYMDKASTRVDLVERKVDVFTKTLGRLENHLDDVAPINVKGNFRKIGESFNNIVHFRKPIRSLMGIPLYLVNAVNVGLTHFPSEDRARLYTDVLEDNLVFKEGISNGFVYSFLDPILCLPRDALRMPLALIGPQSPSIIPETLEYVVRKGVDKVIHTEGNKKRMDDIYLRLAKEDKEKNPSGWRWFVDSLPGIRHPTFALAWGDRYQNYEDTARIPDYVEGSLRLMPGRIVENRATGPGFFEAPGIFHPRRSEIVAFGLFFRDGGAIAAPFISGVIGGNGGEEAGVISGGDKAGGPGAR